MRSGREHEFLDSLYVMEEGMKHFYLKAMHLKRIKGKAELIDANILQAVSIAEKIAPYRHARLSAVKLAGDPNNPVRISDDASIEELKALVQMHLKRLAPVLDLEALMAPGDGIANRDCRSAERAWHGGVASVSGQRRNHTAASDTVTIKRHASRPNRS